MKSRVHFWILFTNAIVKPRKGMNKPLVVHSDFLSLGFQRRDQIGATVDAAICDRSIAGGTLSRTRLFRSKQDRRGWSARHELAQCQLRVSNPRGPGLTEDAADSSAIKLACTTS